MNKTILLVGEKQKSTAVQEIVGLDIDPKNLICITFEPYAKIKSRQQEKLYWMRLGHIAKHIAWEVPIYDEVTGEVERIAIMHKDKDFWHGFLALKYLQPVWISSPTTGEDIPIPRSTKRLNRKEYSEYMARIVEWALEFKIILPEPLDEQYE